jgi:Holliday junction resolvase RusA-like endonuclease
MIKLYFPIEPVPKARPRVTRSGHVYTPKKTKDFEETIKSLATLQMHKYQHGALTGALRTEVSFGLKTPKKKKNSFPIGRPDIDNLQKSLFDALNEIVWNDDSQVCACLATKFYAEKPSITVYVSEACQ